MRTDIYVHRGRVRDVLSPNNVYLGMAAVARKNEQEKLKQLKWALKNMPSTLNEEDKEFLRKNGVKV